MRSKAAVAPVLMWWTNLSAAYRWAGWPEWIDLVPLPKNWHDLALKLRQQVERGWNSRHSACFTLAYVLLDKGGSGTTTTTVLFSPFRNGLFWGAKYLAGWFNVDNGNIHTSHCRNIEDRRKKFEGRASEVLEWRTAFILSWEWITKQNLVKCIISNHQHSRTTKDVR